MKTGDIKNMTVPDLIERFAEICIAQNETLLDNETSEFNRLFDQMQDLVNELRSRPGDQRKALSDLFEHANMQVRLKAAKNSLSVAPEAARRVLEEIANSHHHPQAMEAGMSLWNLSSAACSSRRSCGQGGARRLSAFLDRRAGKPCADSKIPALADQCVVRA